jgi:FixJ family two-component response regulator
VPDTSPIVFVLDEDASVRESLDFLLASAGWRSETFASSQEFLATPPAVVPNCLVLDASLSCPNALDLQKRVAIDRPGTSIIFIAGSADVATTVKAMKAGAVEVFTKPFPEDAQ